jgi:hypothetical protein
MSGKFKTDIDRIFFESTILDIDFSHFREYIGFIVLSTWGEANGEIFPWHHFNVVKFNGVKDLSIQGYDALQKDKSVISVSGFSLEKTPDGFKSATITAERFEINIVFKSYDEDTLSDKESERFRNVFC